jgi:4-amino-4-deoxy-L-arabinose transferase-like glycosyltransferase
VYPSNWNGLKALRLTRYIGLFRIFPVWSPNIYLIPIAKTPVFYYLSALAMKLLGVGFLAPRLVSILATIGILGLIIWLVKMESPSWVPGILAAGIYVASYRVSGAWMDLAKTDSLFLFFILAAFVIGQRTSLARMGFGGSVLHWHS